MLLWRHLRAGLPRPLVQAETAQSWARPQGPPVPRDSSSSATGLPAPHAVKEGVTSPTDTLRPQARGHRPPKAFGSRATRAQPCFQAKSTALRSLQGTAGPAGVGGRGGLARGACPPRVCTLTALTALPFQGRLRGARPACEPPTGQFLVTDATAAWMALAKNFQLRGRPLGAR